MKNFLDLILYGIIVAIVSPLVFIHRAEALKFICDYFDGLMTLFSAAAVVIIYYNEQRQKKINAARLILKEIDSAIPVVKALADDRKYDQKTIVIATDNWPNQIHHFAKDMTQEEIDQINKIYAHGKYINKCIERLDEYRKTVREEIYKEELEKVENADNSPEMIFNDPVVSKKVERADAVPNAVINCAIEAAKEIRDAKSWTGYDKLHKIARLK